MTQPANVTWEVSSQWVSGLLCAMNKALNVAHNSTGKAAEFKRKLKVTPRVSGSRWQRGKQPESNGKIAWAVRKDGAGAVRRVERDRNKLSLEYENVLLAQVTFHWVFQDMITIRLTGCWVMSAASTVHVLFHNSPVIITCMA